MLFLNLFLFSQDNFVHSIQFSSTYLIILHSQSNKLLEHIQNIRIQILSEEQCLQGGTIFFHLFMVHHEYLLKSSNCPTVPEIDVLFDGKFVIYIKLLFRFHGKIVSLKKHNLLPRSFEINPIGIATQKMFRQNHNESLKNDQKKVFLISLGSFQFFFQLFNLQGKKSKIFSIGLILDPAVLAAFFDFT